MSETLILVDCNDRPLGNGEKLAVHRQGLRHRAFSVMIYNEHGEMLIQKRAACKYHSAGLWANACCGHPRPGETPSEAAQRRLVEEIGVHCSTLTPVTEVCYTLSLENGLHENEYTHIFQAQYDGPVSPNPQEVSEIAWALPKDILIDACAHKDHYARWFRLYLFKYFREVFCFSSFESEKVAASRV